MLSSDQQFKSIAQTNIGSDKSTITLDRALRRRIRGLYLVIALLAAVSAGLLLR